MTVLDRMTGLTLAGRRIVVTGAAGFIGGHVVGRLQALGADVVPVDSRPLRDAGRSVTVDLTSPGAVDRAVAHGVAAVVHLAALTSVLGSVARPAETFETNVAVTAALLERCRAVACASFVFASTNAVAGESAGRTIDENIPMRPLTPYGASKAACEMLLSAYSAAYGVQSAALRLTNVYGPGMGGKDSVVPRIIRAARSGAPFEIYGDGHQTRDYVHVDDVVEAVVLAITQGVSGALVIGSGVSTSVLDLVALVREAAGVAIPTRHVGSKPGEMRHVAVDVSLAAGLGWRPSVSLAPGLQALWSSWRGADTPVAVRSA